MNLLPFTAEDVMELKDDLDEMDENVVLYIRRFYVWTAFTFVILLSYDDLSDVKMRFPLKSMKYAYYDSSKDVDLVPQLDVIDLNVQHIKFLRGKGDSTLIYIDNTTVEIRNTRRAGYHRGLSFKKGDQLRLILKKRNIDVSGLHMFSNKDIKMELH